MSTWPLLIFFSVGQRSVSKVKPILYMLGKGALVFYKQLYFKLIFYAITELDALDNVEGQKMSNLYML